MASFFRSETDARSMPRSEYAMALGNLKRRQATSLDGMPLDASLALHFDRGIGRVGGDRQAYPVESLFTTARNTEATAIRNSDGAVLDFAPNVPRVVPGEGLDIWDATDEKVRNAIGAGVVAGTPGTPPTSWFISPNGFTSQIIGNPMVNGVPLIEIEWSGTNVTNTPYVDIEPGNSAIAATAGETVIGSFWFQMVSGDIPEAVSLTMIAHAVGGAVLGTVSQAISNRSTLQRVQAVYPNLPATTSYVRLRLAFSRANNSTLATPMRFRVGLGNARKSTFLTPPVKTSGSAALVPVDDNQVPSPTLYSSLLKGSMYWEFYDPLGPINVLRRGPLFIDAVNLRFIRLFIDADNRLKADYYNGTTGYILPCVNPISAPGGIYKMAVAWGNNQMRVAYSANLGGAASSSAAIVLSATEATAMRLGQNGPTNASNARWRRFEMYRDDLPLVGLQAKVA